MQCEHESERASSQQKADEQLALMEEKVAMAEAKMVMAEMLAEELRRSVPDGEAEGRDTSQAADMSERDQLEQHLQLERDSNQRLQQQLQGAEAARAEAQAERESVQRRLREVEAPKKSWLRVCMGRILLIFASLAVQNGASMLWENWPSQNEPSIVWPHRTKANSSSSSLAQIELLAEANITALPVLAPSRDGIEPNQTEEVIEQGIAETQEVASESNVSDLLDSMLGQQQGIIPTDLDAESFQDPGSEVPPPAPEQMPLLKEPQELASPKAKGGRKRSEKAAWSALSAVTALASLALGYNFT
eukprot:TRINITY_DN2729_c0_g1_i1.p1 TRINITY_DN2729_c0_g1~~TRINITY_DN2729_c0_g1_i1.p1  ORF type:complete len:304 (+),score=78.50 TRINITY_DN2729_c0_g1_i1:1110-2021(+)